jgi:hypothetical protein
VAGSCETGDEPSDSGSAELFVLFCLFVMEMDNVGYS